MCALLSHLGWLEPSPIRSPRGPDGLQEAAPTIWGIRGWRLTRKQTSWSVRLINIVTYLDRKRGGAGASSLKIESTMTKCRAGRHGVRCWLVLVNCQEPKTGKQKVQLYNKDDPLCPSSYIIIHVIGVHCYSGLDRSCYLFGWIVRYFLSFDRLLFPIYKLLTVAYFLISSI